MLEKKARRIQLIDRQKRQKVDCSDTFNTVVVLFVWTEEGNLFSMNGRNDSIRLDSIHLQLERFDSSTVKTRHRIVVQTAPTTQTHPPSPPAVDMDVRAYKHRHNQHRLLFDNTQTTDDAITASLNRWKFVPIERQESGRSIDRQDTKGSSRFVGRDHPHPVGTEYDRLEQVPIV